MIQKFKGEISINSNSSHVNVVSKMQFDSDSVLIPNDDKYTYTEYYPFERFNSILKTLDIQGKDRDKAAIISIDQNNPMQIVIGQKLRKIIMFPMTVNITVEAKKVSNIPVYLKNEYYNALNILQ